MPKIYKVLYLLHHIRLKLMGNQAKVYSGLGILLDWCISQRAHGSLKQ